ncbi:hypothetical protein DOTSEDRAFT_72059 [Dothistroma septosporum NZE10]|uniref:Uncharacterized protein n=1 Tax=Dothistroma septosporum (strain NZE10 / CBS 128990) TaxID=675120 RepID=N1PLS6_DOTSN|nr:hypothetical protein DOTSEDRAFT_72059 [Dothistroma septosporum NZE10]
MFGSQGGYDRAVRSMQMIQVARGPKTELCNAGARYQPRTNTLGQAAYEKNQVSIQWIWIATNWSRMPLWLLRGTKNHVHGPCPVVEAKVGWICQSSDVYMVPS